MKVIVPELDLFLKMFPYFVDKGFTQDDIDYAQYGVTSWISNVVGEIGLVEEMQVRGVYLATAHSFYMTLHPEKWAGRLASATEGSVSAGFQQIPIQTIREWTLSLSPYGLELLQILQQVQPPLPEKALNADIYYEAGIPSKNGRI